jgi:hypothetical protein
MSESNGNGHRPPAFWIANAVLDVHGPRLGLLGVALYTALARYAGKDGRCWPSFEALSLKLGISRRSVIRGIALLESAGLIRVERSRNRPNVYVLLSVEGSALLSPLNGDGGVQPCHSRGDTDALPGVTETTGRGDKNDTRGVTETTRRGDRNAPRRTNKKDQQGRTNKEGPAQARRQDEWPPEKEERFSRLWAAYPRREAKQDARKAFGQLDPDEALLGVMLASLEKHKARPDWRKEGGRYVPLPGTWIRGKRWEDELNGQATQRINSSLYSDELRDRHYGSGS